MTTELSERMTETDGMIVTSGEAAILAKLESIQTQIDELTEKVHNLNLFDNDGFSGDD